MVRHGTQKKRRSGRKVTRKAALKDGVKQRNAVRDADFKKTWDSKIGIVDNYAKAGLLANPNSVDTIRKSNAKDGFVGFADLSSLKNIDRNPKRIEMSEFDQKYALSLIKKYKDDYKKMQFDTKLNTRQLTENQSKKMCEKYLKLEDDQKFV